MAGPVHHDEHVLETTVFFADQVAYSTTIVAVRQHRCRARVNTQLVFE